MLLGKGGDLMMGVFLFFIFCIPFPSCAERTDVAKLINKSFGGVAAPLHISEAAEGKDVLLDHSQAVYQ